MEEQVEKPRNLMGDDENLAAVRFLEVDLDVSGPEVYRYAWRSDPGPLSSYPQLENSEECI